MAAGSSMCAGCSQFEFAVARYVPGGSLDTAFAGDGTTATSIGPGSDRAFGVLIQRGGRVLAVGGAGCHFELARFGGDGSLDATFGMHGTVRTDVGGCGVANDVARAGTERVVVVGPAGSKFGAARYLAS